MDVEIKIPLAEDPELSNVVSFRPDAGQNTTLHTSPAASDGACYFIPLFDFIQLHFVPS